MLQQQARNRQLSLHQQEHFRGFYVDFLKVKRVLAFLGGPLQIRQWNRLFRTVSNRNRLAQLFRVVYGRLDFFLVRSNLAASGVQARQWITHRQVFVSGSPLIASTTGVLVGDTVRLSPQLARRYGGRARLRLLWTSQFQTTTHQVLQKVRHVALHGRPLRALFPLREAVHLLQKWTGVSRRRRYLGRLAGGRRYCGLRDELVFRLRPRVNSSAKIASLYRRRLARRHSVGLGISRYRQRLALNPAPRYWQSNRYSTFMRYHFRSFGVTLVCSPTAVMLPRSSQFELSDLQQLPFTL